MQSDQVTRYLLGQLPESEIQRLNLLRETDENFRQRVTIVEDDLIDCFTKGQLQGEDLMRFRRYFLASAANRERVKVAQGFLDDLRATQLDAPPTWWERAVPVTFKTSLEDFWQRAGQDFWATVREPLLIGLRGVGLLLFVWCLYLAFDLVRLRNRVAELQANEEITQPAVPRTVPATAPAPTNNQLAQQIDQSREKLGQLKAAINTEPTAEPATSPLAVNAAELQAASFNLRPAARGAEGVPELAVTPATEDVAFQLELGRDERASYRAELRAQPDGLRLWQSGTLKARAKDYGNKVLEVRVPAALLKSRAYTLKVYGTNNNGSSEEALNYSFRINKP
ncbi:MAG: hypothetical protein HYR56_04515 [Acidobacteria bacterium]|nr:hypothetical protein [Acidobacteriota bacterium]MBI3426547.1 hypothetical protein [Acidobacteriota bacterium]